MYLLVGLAHLNMWLAFPCAPPYLVIIIQCSLMCCVSRLLWPPTPTLLFTFRLCLVWAGCLRTRGLPCRQWYFLSLYVCFYTSLFVCSSSRWLLGVRLSMWRSGCVDGTREERLIRFSFFTAFKRFAQDLDLLPTGTGRLTTCRYRYMYVRAYNQHPIHSQ